MMKLIKYIFILPFVVLGACSDEGKQEPQPSNDLFITVNLDGKDSRVGYEYTFGEGVNGSGNIQAYWQLGDIIKVYETGVYGVSNAYSDVYASYEDYDALYPYPAVPKTDRYYRFVCVGGEGTSRGVFKYIGLATASVVEVDDKNIHNVDLDILYNHAIYSMHLFQGMAVYENPLRNKLARTQAAKNDLTHIKYGQRLAGYICAHNFDWYNTGVETNSVGIDRVVLQNVSNCIYRIIIGGVDTDIYGGSVLTLAIPGVTDGTGLRGQPMKLTLGEASDEQLGKAPWTVATDPDNAFCAYIVGWSGTMPANATATVTLKEHASGYTYTWNLQSDKEIRFDDGPYYTIDLRNHQYKKTK